MSQESEAQLLTELPEVDPYQAIRDYSTNGGAPDWAYKDFLAEMYWIGDRFRFLHLSRPTEDAPEVPPLLLSVRKMRHEIIGGYHTQRNEFGMRWDIFFNEVHIKLDTWREERRRYAETLLHELLHLASENLPGYRKCVNNYHHSEFQELARSVGLHVNSEGAHTRPGDGLFNRVMELCEIPPLPEEQKSVEVPLSSPRENWWDVGRDKKRGSSTLILYTSDQCPEHPQCKIRSGRRDLMIGCLKCGGLFVPQIST